MKLIAEDIEPAWNLLQAYITHKFQSYEHICICTNDWIVHYIFVIILAFKYDYRLYKVNNVLILYIVYHGNGGLVD